MDQKSIETLYDLGLVQDGRAPPVEGILEKPLKTMLLEGILEKPLKTVLLEGIVKKTLQA